jgi:hypothetical protein
VGNRALVARLCGLAIQRFDSEQAVAERLRIPLSALRAYAAGTESLPDASLLEIMDLLDEQLTPLPPRHA